ncbi:MAG: alpha amylase C-terminal domain-containing protein [Bacteroidales bacterium]|nr:alpha amylase C-terminal domain-containing protein [Bacteroidales bacterium]MCF8390887.1 alpha amylase C-terminal domain-containing protein [Bacteroidales bacterium]
MENPKLIQTDSWLEPFSHIIRQRHEKYLEKLRELDTGKSLEKFANGHLYFGLHKLENSWVIREWAPNATELFLIGDFNNWSQDPNYQFKKLANGNWELSLPLDSVQHKDLYKIRIYWEGGMGDRIPAWARYVVQDEVTKNFNACVWAPEEKYQWKNTKLYSHQESPLIYEAHIGMATEEYKTGSYDEFRLNVLPRIKKAGYNTIQLMAIQEHPYYGSFGYHVSSFFAPSSRFGTPFQLKALIDEAHSLGLRVIMDLVHSHAVKNELEGLGNYDGSKYQFFHDGIRREHIAWDSLCFNYGKNEVIHFLLSNIQYWLKEFNFDGFRFDGITSMLYIDHGLNRDFTSYEMYYDNGQDEDAICYLALANKLCHEINPEAISVAEEMSGYPGLAYPVEDGGLGFDYRMAMGTPDYWIKLIKEKKDEEWNVDEMYYELTRKRDEEKTIAYAESHDQALVGDKTIIFRLIDKDIYYSMDKSSQNLVVDRGIALHKMIRLFTLAAAGNSYLNFMGNEFGHPEWIDFPRAGNDWSYQHARRQWSLADNPFLKYEYLGNFDREMIRLIKEYHLLKIPEIYKKHAHPGDQVLAFRRGKLLFVFNFNPNQSFTDYGISVIPGKYKCLLSSDNSSFGGQDRIDESIIHRSFPERKFTPDQMLKLYLPSRSAIVLERIGVKSVYSV